LYTVEDSCFGAEQNLRQKTGKIKGAPHGRGSIKRQLARTERCGTKGDPMQAFTRQGETRETGVRKKTTRRRTSLTRTEGATPRKRKRQRWVPTGQKCFWKKKGKKIKKNVLGGLGNRSAQFDLSCSFSNGGKKKRTSRRELNLQSKGGRGGGTKKTKTRPSPSHITEWPGGEWRQEKKRHPNAC